MVQRLERVGKVSSGFGMRIEPDGGIAGPVEINVGAFPGFAAQKVIADNVAVFV